jgi:phosphatidylserine/phosphatidylglycerophosphate/cardiolipin synthase-like enzyme
MLQSVNYNAFDVRIKDGGNMSSPNEQLAKDWWAEGDTPVHNDSHVTYFVDGRIAMFSMCLHFLRARKYIYLANWGMTPTIDLVRGTDHRAGPDGSPEQQRLIAELRAFGLTEEDIYFWCTHDLSVLAVLGYAVSKGVEVKVLLWDCPPVGSHYNPQQAHDQLTQVGVTCVLDDSALDVLQHPVEAIGHATESLHQKTSIVDGTHAFVGGVDPIIEKEGEFDRWDTQGHYYSSPLRQTHEGTSPHPWHDAHSIVEGPAAADVEHNFRQRWNDVIQRREMDANLVVLEHPPAPPVATQTLVQVVRTIPEHTYSFADAGIRGIAQVYAKALSNAEHFIYLENQYFWQRAFAGIDVPFLSFDNPEMEFNIRKISEALQRGASVGIVLPDHPNVGRAYSDKGIMHLHERAPEAMQQGRLHVFCLATSTTQNDGEHYRPIYVHAKVGIVDDVWTTVGSGNLNNRGMRNDAEINIATLDPSLAFGMRLMLWAEHLGLYNDRDLFELARYLGRQRQLPDENAHAANILQALQETLSNPLVGLHMMSARAQENLQRYKARQPLVGHLLPYLTAEEAQQQGLNFREEHGWVEEE